MPYKRRYRGRRSFGKRKVRSSPRYTKLVTGKSSLTRGERMLAAGVPYWQTVPAVIKSIGYLSSMINSEVKQVDVTQTNQSVDNSTGFVSSCLTLMAQGDGDNQRNGNKILAKDLHIKGSLQINAANTGSQYVRLMLVCDREASGAAPTVSDLLQAISPFASIDEDFSRRWVMLASKIIPLNTQRPSTTFTMFKKLPFHIFYGAGTGAVTDIKENNIFLVALSDQSANVPTITYYSRFHFYDN